MFSDATYNDIDRTYLIREWDTSLPMIDIIMYYPSYADQFQDDMTTRRTINIAKFNGYGGIRIFNIHDDVQQDIQPISNEIIVAWGNKLTRSESEQIISKFQKKYEVLCFTKLQTGLPGLPTRLPIQTKITKYYYDTHK